MSAFGNVKININYLSNLILGISNLFKTIGEKDNSSSHVIINTEILLLNVTHVINVEQTTKTLTAVMIKVVLANHVSELLLQ